MRGAREYDLVVAGGGPAGSAAAITAARRGARVLLLERGRFPRHKVCGEFVSSESLGVLASLLSQEASLHRLLASTPRIPQVRLYVDGQALRAPIHPPAASITRFDLDAALWGAAKIAGVDCQQQTGVDTVEGAGPFLVRTPAEEHHARAVINAAGRWSKLNETASHAGERWMGIKAHFQTSETAPSVDLYFFDGGYCGVQSIGEGRLNACAMVRRDPDIGGDLPCVLARHPDLLERSRAWQQATETVTTFPLLFGEPVPERNGILHAGDAAGFIDPFLGDGISLALRSGVLAAETLAEVWEGRASLQTAVERYRAVYARSFVPLFRRAARIRQLLSMPPVLRAAAMAALRSEAIAAYVIRKTRNP